MKAQYFMPTRLVSGDGCLVENGSLLKDLGKKALIVTGANSAKANGSLRDAVKALENNGQSYVIFDKVMSNPTVDCAFAGAAAARSNACDFILALGGGSPMDAAKSMALLAAADKEVQVADIFGTAFTRALPVAAVPTTAGTGSEVTQYSILTNDAAETKTSIATPLIFPKLAFLDAGYMDGLKKTVTINTAIDALSHAVEGMLSIRASILSDALAKESITLIASCFKDLLKDNLVAETRKKLLYASTLAGIVIANTGTTAVHALGYSLTYYKHIDHGRANGLLLASFLSFIEKSKQEKVAAILERAGQKSVAGFADMLNELLGAREHLSAAEIEHYAEKAGKTGNIANCIIRPEKEDLRLVLQSALG